MIGLGVLVFAVAARAGDPEPEGVPPVNPPPVAVLTPDLSGFTPEELDAIRNLDLLRNLDMLEDMEVVQYLDALELEEEE